MRTLFILGLILTGCSSNPTPTVHIAPVADDCHITWKHTPELCKSKYGHIRDEAIRASQERFVQWQKEVENAWAQQPTGKRCIDIASLPMTRNNLKKLNECEKAFRRFADEQAQR